MKYVLTWKNANRDERGATAIEYGLIAGLIALGIVGSLVGTRSSLNATYSAVSTGLGGGSSPAAASGGQLPGFQTKTQTNFAKTVSGSQTKYTWTYSDGSTAVYTEDTSSQFARRINMVDKTNAMASNYYTDANGVLNTFTTNTVWPNGVTKDVYYSGVADIAGGTIKTERSDSYDNSGSPTRATRVGAPDAAYLTMVSTNADNFNFYKSLAAQN